MRAVFVVLTGILLFAVSGCVAPPESDVSGPVEGSSVHEQEVRDELWEELYRQKEQDARERMGRPAEEELSE